jgi:hypothetical protein
MADKISGPGNPSPTPDNPRGHWGRWQIIEFHDRILGPFNRDYLGRFHDFALPVAWWADPRVAQIRREIIAFLERRMGSGYFGLKDPRTVRLMPVGHQILNELKLAPKVVLCLRNLAQVAHSLHARDGLDPESGEYRWLVHLVFFRYVNSFDLFMVEYKGWFDNPSADLEKLRKFLDLQVAAERSRSRSGAVGHHRPRSETCSKKSRKQPPNFPRPSNRRPACGRRSVNARLPMSRAAAVGGRWRKRDRGGRGGSLARRVRGATARRRNGGNAGRDCSARSGGTGCGAAMSTRQSEIPALREALAQGEREARERTATQTALQSKIAARQEKLTAAWQVGQAAIVALRAETGSQKNPTSNAGIMRFLPPSG